MELQNKSAKIECSDLKKCGEIATLLTSEKSEFFLNCGFCDYTFLQLDNFIRHMYEDHLLELTCSELKQEVIDMEEFLDKEANLTSVDAAEENYSNDLMLRDFERVEIELDATDIDNSLDIKEDISNELVVEGLKEITRNKHASRKKSEINETLINQDGKSDDYQFFQEIDKLKKDSEFYQNKSKSYMRNYNSDEIQFNNFYDDDGDTFLEKNDSESYSKTDTQANLKSIKKGTIAQDTELDNGHCIILAELYQKYTCLWDEKDIAYRFRNRREEAMKSLLQEFNDKSDLNLTQSELEIEITLLRKACSTEKKQKIACKRNKQRYQPRCSYFNHIIYLEVDVPPFECSECKKLLPGLGQYKVHIASHDGSLPFKCHVCGHGFQLASNLTVHLRRHVHDYTYKCDICDKLCATTTEIKIHMRSHTGEKPFVCSICGQKSRTSSHLLVHTLRHQKRPRHKCKLCPKMFYETGTLNEHMSVHSNVRDKICNVCSKGFTSTKQLRQHQLIHNAEKKYSCKLCGKRFAQFAGLSAHMKSHGTKLSATVSESISFE